MCLCLPEHLLCLCLRSSCACVRVRCTVFVASPGTNNRWSSSGMSGLNTCINIHSPPCSPKIPPCSGTGFGSREIAFVGSPSEAADYRVLVQSGGQTPAPLLPIPRPPPREILRQTMQAIRQAGAGAPSQSVAAANDPLRRLKLQKTLWSEVQVTANSDAVAVPGVIQRAQPAGTGMAELDQMKGNLPLHYSVPDACPQMHH